MRYLITFSYDGSKFHGLQRQINVKNVQGTLEKALSDILQEEIIIKASGRTDNGVHAFKQTAHFDINNRIPRDLKKRLNQLFNKEIEIRSIKRVPDNFHARFSAKKKKYRYIINLDRKNKDDNYMFTSFYKLDITKMRKASSLFIGTHDFKNFTSGYRDDYQTHIFKITIKKKKEKIIIDFFGAGFFRYMVRHLTGALYDIGRGKIEVKDIKKMLEEPNIERKATILPAYGLYLVYVKY